MQRTTIVVGYDGSPCARNALDAVAELAGPDTTVHVVTAYDAPSVQRISEAIARVPDEFKPGLDLLADDRARLVEGEAYFADRQIDHKGHFVDDDPASAILHVAEDTRADLIVVGSRGLGRAGRFLRGSVSSAIATHARTSFMVVQS